MLEALNCCPKAFAGLLAKFVPAPWPPSPELSCRGSQQTRPGPQMTATSPSPTEGNHRKQARQGGQEGMQVGDNHHKEKIRRAPPAALKPAFCLHGETGQAGSIRWAAGKTDCHYKVFCNKLMGDCQARRPKKASTAGSTHEAPEHTAAAEQQFLLHLAVTSDESCERSKPFDDTAR